MCTDVSHLSNVFLPELAVKIQCEEAASVVRQDRINPDDVPAQRILSPQVLINYRTCQRQQLPMLAV